MDPLPTPLLIDSGNSFLKWRFAPVGGTDRGGRESLKEPALEQRLARIWGGLPRPEGIWVASVAGAATNAQINRLICALWDSTPTFPVAPACGHGVVNGYREPERLGIDRWLAMIAARGRTSGPVLVADCGTAVTLDLIDGSGHHRDGVILPGLQTMGRCLLQNTRIAEPPGRSVPPMGEDTERAITRGAQLAIRGAMEHLSSSWSNRLEAPVTLLLTGGDGETIGEGLSLPFRLYPDLVLEGLERVATPAASQAGERGDPS